MSCAAAVDWVQVAFTGHSLGGSLGTLLMLMYVRRGVLPKAAVSPVYTFGAPAVFCEGGANCGCSLLPALAEAAAAGDDRSLAVAPAAEQHAQQCSTDACGVLQALGLPEGAVRWAAPALSSRQRRWTRQHCVVRLRSECLRPSGWLCTLTALTG